VVNRIQLYDLKLLWQLNLIKLSWNINHVKWSKKPFWETLSPSSGSDVTGYLERSLYMPTQNWYLWLGRVKWSLLCLVLLYHWCFTGLFKHVSHKIPCKLRVEPPSLLKLLGFSQIYIASFMMWPMYCYFPSIEMLLKSILSPFDAVFCHHRLLWVVKTYVSHMLFAFSLNGSACLSDIHPITFTVDIVQTRDFQTQLVLGRFRHVDIFYLAGLWMVLTLCLVSNLLTLFVIEFWYGKWLHWSAPPIAELAYSLDIRHY
jgi:hypothetical protein